MNEREIEERVILHSYNRERERALERHPELSDLGHYIDLEALKLSQEEMAANGRVVSTPKAVCRKAVERVRQTFKEKAKSTPNDGSMSNSEYADFFRNLGKNPHKKPIR